MSVYIEDNIIRNIYYSPTTDSQDIVPVLNGYLAEPYSETCLYFNGGNNYLQATDNSKLNFTSPIIVEFKHEAETYAPYIVSKTNTYINLNNEWGIVGNQYVLTFWAGNVTYNTLQFPATINRRYRIKMQIEGSDVVYYVDGVEIGRYVNPNLPSTNTFPFRVGYNFVSNPLHGRLYYLQVGSEIFNINEGSGSTTTGTEGTVLNINGATWVTETGVVKRFYRADTVPGQQEYTTPGNYTWTVPSTVYSVSVVAVGGGASAGGGGGLGWISNYLVTPGQNIDVTVGAGGTGEGNGGDSFFNDLSTCSGRGGIGNGGAGGTFTGDGGGNGGNGSTLSGFRGGGGAGGYSGNGGNASALGNGSVGSGGGGGGGRNDVGGGGVGIYGAGANGAANGGGGSGGSNSSGNVGGAFGGGGGGRSGNYGAGGNGAVRIIWGNSSVVREYPSTNTQDY